MPYNNFFGWKGKAEVLIFNYAALLVSMPSPKYFKYHFNLIFSAWYNIHEESPHNFTLKMTTSKERSLCTFAIVFCFYKKKNLN